MVIKSGPANLLRGAESVGGKLLLEGRQLRFEPHRANVQRATEALEIVDIKRIDRTWTKFLGKIPLAPNAIDVVMRNGQTFSFTVSGRKGWIDAISTAQGETPKG